MSHAHSYNPPSKNPLPFREEERQHIKEKYKVARDNLTAAIKQIISLNTPLRTETTTILSSQLQAYLEAMITGRASEELSETFSESAHLIHPYLKNPDKLIEGLTIHSPNLFNDLRERVIRDLTTTIRDALEPLGESITKRAVWNMDEAILSVNQYYASNSNTRHLRHASVSNQPPMNPTPAPSYHYPQNTSHTPYTLPPQYQGYGPPQPSLLYPSYVLAPGVQEQLYDLHHPAYLASQQGYSPSYPPPYPSFPFMHGHQQSYPIVQFRPFPPLNSLQRHSTTSASALSSPSAPVSSFSETKHYPPETEMTFTDQRIQDIWGSNKFQQRSESPTSMDEWESIEEAMKKETKEYQQSLNTYPTASFPSQTLLEAGVSPSLPRLGK